MASFLPSLTSASVDPDRIGRVRILVVGNPGSGKTSLSHFLSTGTTLQKSSQTVGCNTFVKLVEYPEGRSDHDSASTKPYFVELWDVGANERYKNVRSIFYSDINGVILVHDLRHPRSEATVHKWAKEVARKGTFSAGCAAEEIAANVGGLPVPCLVVGNKCDKATLPSGIYQIRLPSLIALLDWVIQQWQHFKFRRKSDSGSGLVRASSSWPDLESAGSCVSVSASALEGKIDMHAVDAFFQDCISRRYYPTSSAHGMDGHSSATGRFPQTRMPQSSQAQRRSPSTVYPPSTRAASGAGSAGVRPASSAAQRGSLGGMFALAPSRSRRPSDGTKATSPKATEALDSNGATARRDLASLFAPAPGYSGRHDGLKGVGPLAHNAADRPGARRDLASMFHTATGRASDGAAGLGVYGIGGSGPESGGAGSGPPSAPGSHPRAGLLSRTESHMSMASSVSDYGGGENGHLPGHGAGLPAMWHYQGSGRIDDDPM